MLCVLVYMMLSKLYLITKTQSYVGIRKNHFTKSQFLQGTVRKGVIQMY